MENNKRGARLRVSRRPDTTAAATVQVTVDQAPVGADINLRRPNRGPAPTGPVLTLDEFRPPVREGMPS